MNRYRKFSLPVVSGVGSNKDSRIHALRRILPAILCCFSAISLSAQTNFITLNNQTVHPTRILAKFKDGALAGWGTEAASQDGSRIRQRYTLIPGLAVLDESSTLARATVSANDEETRRTRLSNRIEALRASGLFEYVEPDYIVHAFLAPNDQAFVDGTLWGLLNRGQNGGTSGADIGATNAWDITTGSTNVIVAVIDTGIRYTHQDLATQMWRNPGETAGNGRDDDNNGYVDDVYGINAITGVGDPFDDNNHGTHVSGTIGAAANNGKPHVGVTWRVRLMGCKFLTAQGFGSTSDAITCIDYAVNKGAKILNNSWGGGAFSQALFDAINNARTKGVLFVASAGNNSFNHDVTPVYPASYKLDNIIAVAALDRKDRLADFSDYGQTTVHLGAPGVEIYSSTAGSDSDYQFFDGTSQACPHVSGVAALILSQYPGADLDELRGRILASAVPIPSLSGKTITGGRVNAYNALTVPGSGIIQVSVDPPSGSTLLNSSAQPIFVKVKDIVGVTNATVTASIPGVTNLTFANDGQTPDALAGDPIYSALLQVPASAAPLTMTVTTSAPGKVGSTNIVSYTVVPPPPNDNFTNAAKVPSGGALILSNNKFATIEPSEPVHAAVLSVAASLWWNWSPTTNTNVLVDATGSAINAVVAVYTGTNLNNLQQVAASVGNLVQKKPAFVSFNAQAGVAYFIAVASVDTNSLGSIRLRVAPGGQLDHNRPSVFITSPSSGGSVNERVFTLAGTAFDSAPDPSGVTEVLVSVNNGIASPANGATNWASTILLQPGANLIRAVAVDAAGNFSLPASIQVSFIPPGVSNDLFVNATPLAGSTGTNLVSTIQATKEPGEPQFVAGNVGGKSVWWTYLPATAGVLTLSTTNSTFDTIMALYTSDNDTSTRITNLVTVASNDDAYSGVTFSKISQAVSNRTYWILVDGFNGASGNASLTYSFTSSNIFHLTVNTIASGTVVPASGDFADGSTVVLAATPDPNYEFVEWVGEGITSTANPLSIVINANLILTARFRVHEFTDGFEPTFSPSLSWANDPTHPWVIQSTNVAFGQNAARSAVIANRESSTLTLTIQSGSGVGSFDYKVSSETNWDWLEFYLNGVPGSSSPLQRWSGEVGWATYQFSIPAGTNTLVWRYIKDPTVSAGSDAAFIDNVEIPPVSTTSTLLRLLNPALGGFQVQLQGSGSQSVRIQGSSNLASWKDIWSGVLSNGTVIPFSDPQAPYPSYRFYRAVSP
jgi:subtilisin family serine protease